MKKTISVLLAVVVMLSCGSLALAEEKKTLTIAASADMSTLGMLNMEQQNTLALRLVYEGLVHFRDGGVKPLLAESWSFNDEGTELTLNLRKNVTFHDGSAFNADALITWFEMHANNPTNAAFIMVNANMTGAEKIDDYTVKFKFSMPYFNYMEDMCYADVMKLVATDMINLENKLINTENGNYGSGPYYIAESNAEATRLVKYEGYWGDLSAYPFDEIIIKTIHDENSRLMALRNGEVDVLYGSMFVSPEQYKQGLSLEGVSGKAAEHYATTLNLTLNCAKSNLSDVRVREAIEHALDKQALSDGITYGLEVPTDALFPKELKYCNVDTVTRSYDTEKANALLDEAGWLMNESTGVREKDGEALHLVFTYDSGEAINRQLGIALQSMLAEVGIELETKPQDIYVWWGGCVEGAYDITLWNVSLEPHTVPGRLFISWPVCTAHTPSLKGLKDSDVCISLIEEFSKTYDEKRVAEIFEELFHYSANNVLNIPLMFTRDVILYRTDVVVDYNFPDNTRFFEGDCIVSKE
jgi:nickel transport system substrate-binding protein